NLPVAQAHAAGWTSRLRASLLPEMEAGPKLLERWSFHYEPCADPAAGAAADFCPAAALFGAPVNPAAAPTPSMSSQRGQGCEALPFSARSITSRAIFSTTCSK